MAAAAIDVNKGITGDKSAQIRNYNTQPHLSKYKKFNLI